MSVSRCGATAFAGARGVALHMMKPGMTGVGLAAQLTDAGNPLRVVVVYDDRHRRNRAMAICERLTQDLGAEFEFDVDWFKASHLRDEQIEREACAKAATADLVVFSIHPALDLSPEIIQWIRRWVPARPPGAGGALALLVESLGMVPLTALPARFELALAARQAGMDFLCETAGSFTSHPQLTPEVISGQASRMTPVLSEILDHRVAAPVHGGINE